MNIFRKRFFKICVLLYFIHLALERNKTIWQPVSVRPDVDFGIENARSVLFEVKLSNGKETTGHYDGEKWSYKQGDEYSATYRGPLWTVEYWSPSHKSMQSGL